MFIRLAKAAHAEEEANAQSGRGGATPVVAPAPTAARSATVPDAEAEAEAKAEAESNGGDDDDWGATDGAAASNVSAAAQGRALIHKMRARQSRMKCANCCNILGPGVLVTGWRQRALPSDRNVRFPWDLGMISEPKPV